MLYNSLPKPRYMLLLLKKLEAKNRINKTTKHYQKNIYIFCFIYSNLPTVLNSFGLHWQYWVAKASIIRSIFWASPGKRKLQRKSLKWSRKLLSKAQGKPLKYFILANQSLTYFIFDSEKLKLLNPFLITGPFLYPLKTTRNLWFCYVFRSYRKRPVAWNWLTGKS